MPGIGEFALGVVASLVANALTSATGYMALPFFERRRVQSRIEDAIAEVVEPLVPFLAQEGISENQQRLLFDACKIELQPFTEDPAPLFSGSLDGQKIFDDLYTKKDLPATVRDEGLDSLYSMLFPRIATLLCRIPAAVKDWENNAWSENYRRLDDIAVELRQLFLKLDSVEERLSDSSDDFLAIARRVLTQRVSMQLDLTGLRADKPIAGKMEDFFVHPELSIIEEKSSVAVESGEEALETFVRNTSLSVVLGQPGSGKSTWTRWLQREALTTSWPGMTIRLELRQLDSSSLPSIDEVIRDSLTVHLRERVGADRVQTWINDRSLVFLLDGFDEIAPADRGPVIAWINELQMAAGSCNIILTSRPLTTDHLEQLSPAWLRWEIKPFDEPRVLEYIRRWYAKAPLLVDSDSDVDPEQVFLQLTGDPTIGPLTANPLLLSTLLMVHHLDGSLPSGRAELYKRYIDGMLGLWDDRRKVSAADVSLTLAEKRQILSFFAVHFQLRQKDQIDENEAISIAEECLRVMRKKQDALQVLSTLRERSGLLIGPGIYSFVHKSVSEFLVAELAVQESHIDATGKRIDRFRLFKHREDDRWNVVIFLWAGLAPFADLESFIDECIEADDIKLAYGIISDQYERFNPQSKRQFILRLLTCKPNVERGFFFWVVSGPTNIVRGDHLEIPSTELRGIGHTQLANLFFRAATDGFLSWSDAKRLRGILRELVWMSVAAHSNDLDDWKACIKPLPATLKDSELWSHWLAQRVVDSHIMHENEVDLHSRISIHNETFPDQAGILTVATLNNLVRYKDEDGAGGLLKQRNIDSILTCLETLQDEPIHADILLGTSDWSSSIRPKESGDLLEKSADLLQAWSVDDLKRQKRYQGAIEKVAELMKLRGELAEEREALDTK
jgi:hypothetical protein